MSRKAKTPREIGSMARAHTETCIRKLAGIMNEPSAPHASRIAAIGMLLERGHGKAVQAIDLTGDAGLVINVLRMDTDSITAIEHKPSDTSDLAQLDQAQATPKEHATLTDNYDNPSNEPDKLLNTLD